MFPFSLLTIRREVRRRRTSIRGRRMLMSSKAPWYRSSMMVRFKPSLRDRCDRAAPRSSQDLEERELNGTGETNCLNDHTARLTTDDLPALANVSFASPHLRKSGRICSGCGRFYLCSPIPTRRLEPRTSAQRMCAIEIQFDELLQTSSAKGPFSLFLSTPIEC